MRSILIVLALSMAAPAAYADKSSGSLKRLLQLNHTVEAGLFLGGLLPSEQHEMYDNSLVDQKSLGGGGLEVGLRLGYLPVALGGVEIEGMLAPIGVDGGGSGMITGFRGHLLLQFPLVVTPFLVGGVGTMGLSSDDDVQGNDRDLVSHLGVGAKYEFMDWMVARLDLRQTIAPRARSVGYTTHYEVLVGLSGSWDLGKKAESAPESGTTSTDSDGDGVPNEDDQCPELSGEPPLGCPTADGDKDGVLDATDRCPTEAEDKDGFEDEDGCPDLDNDQDGIPDATDKCPNKIETLNGVEDDDGCPEDVSDTDNDGVADAVDKCISEPEDRDGFQDADGCPDPDNDGDGVMDDRDGCPEKPGVLDNNGCPDVDTDSDGVPDRIDNCPNQPGTPENFGCKKKQLVKLSSAKIEILQKVFFATGNAKIKKRSFALLDNISAVMLAHPEIKRVRIEGHSDTVGSADANKQLSQKRAESVVRYLEEKGIVPERLEPIGYGQEHPIAPNTTRRGRASNRRVEFTIVDDVPSSE